MTRLLRILLVLGGLAWCGAAGAQSAQSLTEKLSLTSPKALEANEAGEKALVSGDAALAIEKFGAACDGRYPGSCLKAGLVLARSPASPEHVARARAFYARGCSHGDPDACRALAPMQQHGIGGKADLAGAITTYAMLCAASDKGACANQSRLSKRAEAKTAGTAPRYVRNALEQKRYFQGAMELDRIGAKIEARKMLQSSCFDDRNDEGCHNYAVMADSGEGGDEDGAAARAAYRLACDLNLKPSCYNLAEMFLRGRGGAKTNPEALALYTALCSSGHGAACHNGGLMTERGMGVARPDLEKAIAMYRTGCEYNYRRACDAVDAGTGGK